MNKKELADLRKEFKLNSYMMSIKEIYSIYLKKDNNEIIKKELSYFDMLEIEIKELYLNNFKKVLTGTIDTKIFELDFNSENLEESTQKVLYKALNSEERVAEYADKIVEKISENYTYDTDIVINFVKAEYYKGSKKRREEIDESAADSVQAIQFILCSINKVDIPKRVLKFDYEERTFKPNSALDTTINLNSPLDGFMFPSFSDGNMDVNKVVYYSSKSKQLNLKFVEEVLNCSTKQTAVEEKERFNAILNDVIGDKIKADAMQEIYEKINEKLEDNIDEEEPTVNMTEIKRVLEDSGVDNTEILESSFEEICGGDYDFKVKNIIPDFRSKSIKIENEDTSISINPRDLSSVKQFIDKNGTRCLVIELSDDVEINGFKLEMEGEDSSKLIPFAKAQDSEVVNNIQRA
ncbi:hypothetical protein CPAST_c18050 [Clostridium pasteurianum DSM 525 = ATCC 6013]|uniref:DUF4317 family protein n=1 Tax=Clostridium pasteurianum DSM 525 = ATCC 6013 TaxID=1262449 RepID=A0A0H3J9P3_CLOPA|nr:DUF4317 domain-containing protein [Clostridium pasteurianum]AJA47875.1 hypothetical protein CPAST_c18050 [Clostridium pasteurianum DSM 525 = ATCC 6013]AJA51863.1 hypothetical protein CLPA_c18050 [Clostridium pasteurianum DSM 525 = ATCC 6013]AOZ75166.1 hypothetical protein AQ983_08760 [Clostridium pasteurianum DSM 525 = ATCC 6013]AOZ78961.1 hypothetical protein AQ984_08750 [Clostridium pasteurianum]ELP59778.1 hypothetical protein F502_07933 [Clostridium pasteurianum DSM 525 = ATCC 6013]